MFKYNKFALAIFFSTALVGCANIENSFNNSEQNFKQYQEITQQYQINENWWQLYQDPELNGLIERALANNTDLAKAAINVNIALYNANILGANLVPSFSGSTRSAAEKNIETGGNSAISHRGTLDVSYTLDLWQRLADKSNAAEWQHEATVQDLAAAKLSLINAVVTTYYQLAYLQDAIKVAESSVNYYQRLNNIMQNKVKQGMVDSVSSDQAQQAVLAARNNLISYQTQQKVAQQTLRNLMNLKPNESVTIKYPNILAVKNVGVDLNVPISTIANRPDVKGYEYRLRSAFKDAKATQKSWFPSITLGASLASAGNKVDNALSTPVATGLVSINLPFLAWNTVKWNVKISEANYEIARLNFEKSITSALNEIDANYFAYTQARLNLENLQQKFNYDRRITQYYQNRYNAGVAELKDWINAANTENNSQLSILNAKYNLIQRENAVYSAMAGYYQAK